MLPDLIFTVSIKSETTKKEGSKAIKMPADPKKALEVFYEAVRDCLSQIAGVDDGENKENSLSS